MIKSPSLSELYVDIYKLKANSSKIFDSLNFIIKHDGREILKSIISAILFYPYMVKSSIEKNDFEIIKRMQSVFLEAEVLYDLIITIDCNSAAAYTLGDILEECRNSMKGERDNEKFEIIAAASTILVPMSKKTFHENIKQLEEMMIMFDEVNAMESGFYYGSIAQWLEQ